MAVSEDGSVRVYDYFNLVLTAHHLVLGGCIQRVALNPSDPTVFLACSDSVDILFVRPVMSQVDAIRGKCVLSALHTLLHHHHHLLLLLLPFVV